MPNRPQTLALVVLASAMFTPLAPAQMLTIPISTPRVIPGEAVLLTRHGLSRQTITRPAGPFILYVENHLDNKVETLTLSVDTAPQTGLAALATTAITPNTGTVLNLAPGTYHLSFATNAGFSLKIVIQ